MFYICLVQFGTREHIDTHAETNYGNFSVMTGRVAEPAPRTPLRDGQGRAGTRVGRTRHLLWAPDLRGTRNLSHQEK